MFGIDPRIATFIGCVLLIAPFAYYLLQKNAKCCILISYILKGLMVLNIGFFLMTFSVLLKDFSLLDTILAFIVMVIIWGCCYLGAEYFVQLSKNWQQMKKSQSKSNIKS